MRDLTLIFKTSMQTGMLLLKQSATLRINRQR